MKNKNTLIGITALILGAVASRLLPHPPNVAPITAIALLGAAYYPKKWQAFLIPFVIMLISDFFIGFHSTIPFVYGSFALIVGLGLFLRQKFSWGKLLGISLASSVLFFLITNFGVWLVYDAYPENFAGLLESYIAGIPFFRNSLLGDLGYSFALFGLAEVLKKYSLIQPADAS